MIHQLLRSAEVIGREGLLVTVTTHLQLPLLTVAGWVNQPPYMANSR